MRHHTWPGGCFSCLFVGTGLLVAQAELDLDGLEFLILLRLLPNAWTRGLSLAAFTLSVLVG